MSKKMKIRLINWEKVNYQVKPHAIKNMVDLDYYSKQPKAWQLLFTLTYLLVIYTTFIVGLPVFLTLSNTTLWFLPFLAILMTVFFMGGDLLDSFTKWIKIPVSIYMLLLFLYFLLFSIN